MPNVCLEVMGAFTATPILDQKSITYSFFFPTGWEGFRCEEDINECASNPCVHGICIQREPGLGYTCYCTSGYVV